MSTSKLIWKIKYWQLSLTNRWQEMEIVEFETFPHPGSLISFGIILYGWCGKFLCRASSWAMATWTAQVRPGETLNFSHFGRRHLFGSFYPKTRKLNAFLLMPLRSGVEPFPVSSCSQHLAPTASPETTGYTMTTRFYFWHSTPRQFPKTRHNCKLLSLSTTIISRTWYIPKVTRSSKNHFPDE